MPLTQVQGDMVAGGTSALTVPAGTTAQRPASPTVGMQRWNTTLQQMEVWTGINWQVVASAGYEVDYLIVAGGGGAGFDAGGGGGAGGVVSGSGYSLIANTIYTVTIGGGGTGSTGVLASSGSNTSFLAGGVGYTATGGGYGGEGLAGSGTSIGGNGGSGGGSAGDVPNTVYSGGSGTFGQGYAGGSGFHTSGYNTGGGGGGGATTVGENQPGTPPTSNPQRAGNGGTGLNWQSLGSYYGGGGGGGINNDGGNTGAAGTGGLGGGGNGSRTGAGSSGAANTGGGGGGGCRMNGNGGSGGSGIVIIRYIGSQRGTGGTVTSIGGYTYHTFTSSGTYIA